MPQQKSLLPSYVLLSLVKYIAAVWFARIHWLLLRTLLWVNLFPRSQMANSVLNWLQTFMVVVSLFPGVVVSLAPLYGEAASHLQDKYLVHLKVSNSGFCFLFDWIFLVLFVLDATHLFHEFGLFVKTCTGCSFPVWFLNLVPPLLKLVITQNDRWHKTYLVMSNGELMIKHCEKRLPVKTSGLKPFFKHLKAYKKAFFVSCNFNGQLGQNFQRFFYFVHNDGIHQLRFCVFFLPKVYCALTVARWFCF